MTNPERLYTAQKIREIRKILRGNPPLPPSFELQEDTKHLFSAMMFSVCLLAGCLVFIGGCFEGKAHAYTDEQIVNAIYKAEGGKDAKYPYGIRSVSCSTKKECRAICLRTVRHNRKRYGNDERFPNVDFISYLERYYAPIGCGNDPKNLNSNWIKNVMFFLKETV